jgi:hypothetical protein
MVKGRACAPIILKKDGPTSILSLIISKRKRKQEKTAFFKLCKDFKTFLR